MAANIFETITGMLGKAVDGVEVSDAQAKTVGDVGRGMKVLGGALEDAAKEAGPDDKDTPNRFTLGEAGFIFVKHLGGNVGKSSPPPEE